MEPSRSERRRRAVLAGHDGDTAAASALLADDDAGVRASALRALARVDALTTDVLVTTGRDSSPVVRIATLEVVARLSDPDLDGLVAERLDDADATVVDAAAWAAGERERATDVVVDRLVGLATDHADALVREAAVAALGAIGDTRGLPAILVATRDKATVRRRAVLALAPFEGAEVDSALAAATTDRDWQVRQAAEDLLS